MGGGADQKECLDCRVQRLRVPRRRKANDGQLIHGSSGKGYNHIVRSRNCNTILKWMPTHVENLLVEVDLIRVRLFPHPSALTTYSCSGAAALELPLFPDGPFVGLVDELMGVGIPTFLALKADLSACNTTSISFSGSDG